MVAQMSAGIKGHRIHKDAAIRPNMKSTASVVRVRSCRTSSTMTTARSPRAGLFKVHLDSFLAAITLCDASSALRRAGSECDATARSAARCEPDRATTRVLEISADRERSPLIYTAHLAAPHIRNELDSPAPEIRVRGV